MCIILGVLALGFDASPSNIFPYFDLAYGLLFMVYFVMSLFNFLTQLFHLIMVKVLSNGHLKKDKSYFMHCQLM